MSAVVCFCAPVVLNLANKDSLELGPMSFLTCAHGSCFCFSLHFVEQF